MHHAEVSILESALILLVMAVAAGVVAHRLKMSPTLGYLIAGWLVGPYGFSLVTYNHGILLAGELGVAVLLFMEGLGLSHERLQALRGYIFGMGFLQMAGCAATFTAIASYAGLAWPAALVVGVSLSLSSPATVLQLLLERGKTATRPGRITTSILIFQDVLVVFFLLILSFTAKEAGPHAVGGALQSGVAAMAALLIIAVAGRYLINPLYSMIAKTGNRELFGATTLGMVLWVAWFMSAAGISISVGALLAGVALSGSRYRHQIENDILPFRGLFMGVFFMTVGMQIDTSYIYNNATSVLLITMAIIWIKTLILLVILPLFRVDWPWVIRIATILAHSGEYALISLSLAQGTLVPENISQLLMASIALSIFLTPFMLHGGNLLGTMVQKFHPAPLKRENGDPELRNHVILAGYGRMGHTIARVLALGHVPYVVLDKDINRVIWAQKEGLPVYYGDVHFFEIFRNFGVRKAAAVILAVDDPAVVEKAAALLKRHFPKIPIIARSQDSLHHHCLEASGVNHVVPDLMEASLAIGESALKYAGASEGKIERIMAKCHHKTYAFFHEEPPLKNKNHKVIKHPPKRQRDHHPP